METQIFIYPAQELIVLTSRGTLDLPRSKQLLQRLTGSPDYDRRFKILLDLREMNCALSVMDAYELAVHMAWPNPALPTRRQVAVLVPAGRFFDHVAFLSTCAQNRGLNIRSFASYEDAMAWLSVNTP
ncbi:hypothetical protein GQ464_013740 [Rhodocaloribacter litoris]|uniref:hypothetical protein n=1 Tax=Rhodocaloribacter litoris TaxID=2558931 RepID=UPI00141EF1B6|nr:hypothetical protein [Rhodocaloribacter litoris]QXD14486.1 hypothetical protein GQ464_013740 [Rhodocaloribacter litoris]